MCMTVKPHPHPQEMRNLVLQLLEKGLEYSSAVSPL